MRIYSNYPCRMTLAELDNDLPCKEAIFSSRHPFMQDDSIFAPRLTISQAWALLFEPKARSAESSASGQLARLESGESGAPPEDGENNYDLTVFDLFILIHRKILSPTSLEEAP